MRHEKSYIYARVSTEDQRGNYSIPSQIDECKRYVESKRYTLIGNRYVDPITRFDVLEGVPAFVDDFLSREFHAEHLMYNYSTSTFSPLVCGMLRFTVRFHRFAQ